MTDPRTIELGTATATVYPNGSVVFLSGTTETHVNGQQFAKLAGFWEACLENWEDVDD